MAYEALKAAKEKAGEFADSNFYSVMQGMYDELGVVGISAMLIEEDFESVARFRHLTVEEYRLAGPAPTKKKILLGQ